MSRAESEPDRERTVRPPSRDSLEFTAGLLLGVAAGIGLGMAFRDTALCRCFDSRGRRGRGRGRAARLARRLRRG